VRVQLDMSIGMRGLRTLLAGGNTLRAEGEPAPEGADATTATATATAPATGIPRFILQ
jgi:hypothetical protein